MAKVSVVIPVYNVEKYIETCVRSLFEQTLHDVEYVFVDDCSPDRSVEILKGLVGEYQTRLEEEGKVVRILRMPVNSGQAKVRREGVAHCTGEYIIHCDSDDWVETDMYRAMYETAVASGSDVVVCDYRMTCTTSDVGTSCTCHAHDARELIRNSLYLKDSWALWNKMFRRRCYSGIRFPSEAMGEDMVITVQLLLSCGSFSHIPGPYYNYRMNPQSTTKKITKESCLRRFRQLKANSDLLFEILAEKPAGLDLSDGMVFFRNHIRSKLLPLVWNDEYYLLWRDTYPDLNRKVLLSRHIGMDVKLKVLLTTLRLYPGKKDRII